VSERFHDVGRGVTLCYETFGDDTAPPLLLIMGLGMQMVAWPDAFCTELAGRGFYVVRFDNRDVGRSTRFSQVPPPSVKQIVLRRFATEQYTIGDMAADAAGLLRELELAPAHVVGLSLGGMIAQTLAAEHPELVRSLTSIMSNTGHRFKGQPAPSLYRFLLTRAPGDREGFLDHYVRLFTAIGSKQLPSSPDELRALATAAYERGVDPDGTGRQLAAILKSGNRTRQLRTITAPTLVVHGTRDRLVRPSGGKATAAAVPGARLVKIPDMAHDLPRAVWDRVIVAIAAHAHAADAREPATTVS
jgi:pimeloyl-ACP methyl ester carboxylesterase